MQQALFAVSAMAHAALGWCKTGMSVCTQDDFRMMLLAHASTQRNVVLQMPEMPAEPK